MLRSTLSMGFLQIPQPGGCPGPPASSLKPDVDFLRYYIFLIAMYRRASGSDLTATSPSAVPAAAIVIAVTCPSVRVTFLLLSGEYATAARDIDVPHPGAGHALRRRPGALPA